MEPRIMIWNFESEKASTNYVLNKLIFHLQIAMNVPKSLRCLVVQNNITSRILEE